MLSLDDFRHRYSEKNLYYEYWFGKAVQKSGATVLHALLVKLLLSALDRAGYESGPELEIRIDPNWQPKADVAAWTKMAGSYPTEPIDVVVEVLSPEDQMQRVIAKCRQYERIGIKAIFVMDPESHDAWEWSRKEENLERITTMTLPNGRQIAVTDLWAELIIRAASN